MAEFKLGYKHYPKDLKKFGYIDQEDPLTNLRFGNDTFIELGRNEGQITRTLGLFFGTLTTIGALLFISLVVELFFLPHKSKEITIVLIFIILSLFYIAYVAFFLYFTQNAIWPRDYPVRFNRKTGKVYVYEPALSKRHYYFPLKEIKRLYRPTIKVYDWQDIEGMVTRKGFFFQQAFFAAVIDRQSDTLIDHFCLWDNANFFNNEEWRWLLSYMDGMQGLNYKGKIRGRFWLGRLCNCFAPEFSWPEGIEKASRAESLAELAKIEQQYNLTGKCYPYE